MTAIDNMIFKDSLFLVLEISLEKTVREVLRN